MSGIVARPADLPITVWLGSTHTVVLTFPEGVVDASWSAKVICEDAGIEEDLLVAVDDNVLTVTFDPPTTDIFDTCCRWFLYDGDGQAQIVGDYSTTTEPGPSTTTADVVIEESEVVVTVIGGGDLVTSVNGQTGAVVLDADDVGADPAGSAQDVADDLADHETDFVAHRIRPVLWDTAAGWDRWSVIPVTNMDVTTDVVGVTAEGAATIEATGPSGSDRRIYQLDSFGEAADMEARVTYDADAGAQVGIALRVNPAVALLAWQNIFFGASASILRGVWEWVPPGDTGTLTTNQTGQTPATEQAIISAEGDGTTVTVRSELPHLLKRTTGNVKLFFGPFTGSTTFSATPIDATTFEVSSSEVGSWTEGTWNQDGVILAGNIRRHIKAAIRGDLFSIAHWFDDEPEPGLLDPLRSTTLPLPDPLGSSGGPPPASGGVGLMFGHLGNVSKTLTVYDFDARALT